MQGEVYCDAVITKSCPEVPFWAGTLSLSALTSLGFRIPSERECDLTQLRVSAANIPSSVSW